MIRIAGAVFAGLLLAIIIHILVVLSVPLVAPMDNWKRVEKFGEQGQFVSIPSAAPGIDPMPLNDPTMEQLVCRFSQETGYVTISASMPDDFWSFALYSRSGKTLFSLNDRTSDGDTLLLVVVSPDQLGRLRENPPSDLDASIVVETSEKWGIAILRAFVANPQKREEIRTALAEAQCLTGSGAP